MLRALSTSGRASVRRSHLSARSLAYYKYVGDGGHCPKEHDSAWETIAKKFQGPPNPGTLILVRHGETEWNQKRLFTGWVDVDLSDRGIREIEHASRLLLERGYTVDITYTSVLRRAVRSSWIMLNEIDQIYGPVIKSWRLNERMYGALEGHSKPGLAHLYGDKVVQQWREGLTDRPPAMTSDHPYWHGKEGKYNSLPAHLMPATESLEDTISRTAPLWHSHILPDLKAGRNVLIVAHRNSIRGILKIIDGISTADIQQVSVPNGIPLVYKFDADMRPVSHKNAVKPLSGIWLGKTGLLRAALDQEAELAKHIEGYSYSPTGNKYDTKTFYYHSSALTSNLRSKYSAQEHPDPAEGGDTEAAVEAAHDHSSALKYSPRVDNNDAAPSFNADLQSISDTVYGGSDAHLIRKLIFLEQERKLFSLVDDQGKEKNKSAFPKIPGAKVNADSEYSTSADIYIDPIVLRIQPPVYEQNHKFPPVESCEVGSITPDGAHVVDVARLNQTWYYEHPVDTDTTDASDGGTVSTAQHSSGPEAGHQQQPQCSMDETSASAAAAAVTATPVPAPVADPVSAAIASARRLLQSPVLVIIRHGKTEHNKLGLFTGWEDAALSPEGRKEARFAGKLLRRYGVKFDVVYTSWLSRAIETAWLVMNELDVLWLPIIKTWRLNERMYGALTGLSKKMIRQLYGDEQFKKWRRGYDEPPPPISSFSAAYPGNDSRYVKYVQDMPISWFESFIRSLAHGKVEVHRALPKTESLKDCMDRTIPFFLKEIQPDSIAAGKNVLIASSENAIRGLLMHLCNIPESRIHAVEIPTGLPLVYDPQLRKIRLLQEQAPRGSNAEGAGATVLSGSALLEKYHFGDNPELLFALDEVDIAIEGVERNSKNSSRNSNGSNSSI